MNTPSEEVINYIKGGGTKMRSRSYFVTRAIFGIIGAILVFLLIFFVITFIIFALEENGGLFAVGFGLGGWAIFLESLPWTLLLLSVALILILWLLLRRYSIVYRQPFLYALLTLIIVIGISLFFLSANSLHGYIFRYASNNRIPVLSGVYQFETAPLGGLYRGELVAFIPGGFILGNDEGQTSTVFVIPAATSELSKLAPGNYVLIFGHGIATATIEASGVERIVYYQ